MKLWLVRHAQPLVAAGVCYGRLDIAADAPATRLCAQALAQALPAGAALVTSPLQRCEQLAQALHGLRPDLACKTEPRLQEMDFGDWEGRRWESIGQPALDAWVADFAGHRPGGGESVQDFMQRVAAVWDEVWDQSPASVSDTVWITHAGVMHASTLLQRGLRQISQAGQWPTSTAGFGEWLVIP